MPSEQTNKTVGERMTEARKSRASGVSARSEEGSKTSSPRYEITRKKQKKSDVKAKRTTYVVHRKPEDTPPKKRSVGAIILVCALVLLGALSIGFYFLATVNEIEINGNSRFSDREIINLSGLYTGKNILLYDLAGARDNIEKNPYIDCIGVRRVLPHTISITVREREEFAAITASGGLSCIIDREGFVLDVGRRTSLEGLIPVYGLGSMGFTTGTSIISDKSKLRPYTVMELIDCIGERIDMIEYIDVSNAASVKIGLRSGATIMFGDSKDVAEKTEYMFRAIEKADSDKLSGTVIYVNSNGTADIAYPTPTPAAPTDTPEPADTPEPSETNEADSTDTP